MSELMNQLGKTQEEVRRLASKLDRADAMLAKAGDTEHALKDEVRARMVERDQLLEERDDLYEARKELQADVEFLTKERDDALERAKRSEEEVRATWQVLDGGTPVTTGLAGAVLERLKQKDANPEVTVDEVERAASEAGWEASDFRVAMDVAKRFGWLAVTVPPTDL